MTMPKRKRTTAGSVTYRLVYRQGVLLYDVNLYDKEIYFTCLVLFWKNQFVMSPPHRTLIDQMIRLD